ncbi:MAG TPA: hypothetical protein VHE55_11115 [Fimbriimonadaceae bacterium]|nr:hypothetical protein [Fimbriimonadaceae bacterium]
MAYSDTMLDWSPGDDDILQALAETTGDHKGQTGGQKGGQTAGQASGGQTPPAPTKPEHKDLTFGSQDLAWLVPAIIAAVSGRGGQQFAGGLLQGAVKAKINRNLQENKRLMDIWKAQLPKKKDDGSDANADSDYADLYASVDDPGGSGGPADNQAPPPSYQPIPEAKASHQDSYSPPTFDPMMEAQMALSAIKRDPLHAKFYQTLFALRMGRHYRFGQSPRTRPSQPGGTIGSEPLWS